MRKIAEIFFSKQDTKDFMNRHTWTALGGATLKPYPHTIEMMTLDY